MATSSSGNPAAESFRLFPSDENHVGLGFHDSSESSPPPSPPPCVEVLSSEVSGSLNYPVEPVNLGAVTLLKGRVSTKEVFALSNSDLVPGKYEGGLKLWEGSLDLIKYLHSAIQNEQLCIKGMRVLEIGCGHGLPGIFALLQGASVIHFQDFNAEVLKCLTIPNLYANSTKGSQIFDANASEWASRAELRFIAGDWRDVHQLLFDSHSEKEMDCSSGWHVAASYDLILMAETVYSNSNLQCLYELIKKCMKNPGGVTYMAAKKYYFGVGGGTRRFVSLVQKDGVMVANMVAEVTDGSSNVRENVIYAKHDQGKNMYRPGKLCGAYLLETSHFETDKIHDLKSKTSKKK